MEITLLNRTNTDITAFEELFKKIAASAEKKLKLKGDSIISVTFVRSLLPQDLIVMGVLGIVGRSARGMRNSIPCSFLYHKSVVYSNPCAGL